MTLDVLPKNELIAVLDELRDCIGIKQAAQKRIQELKQVFVNDELTLKKNKKFRIILLIIAGFCTYGYGTFAVGFVGLLPAALVRSPSGGEFILLIVGILSVFFLIGLILFWRFIIKKFKNKNSQERIDTEKYQAGIYAYIPYFQGIYDEFQKREDALCAKYNIHNNVRTIGLIDYVKSVMVSSSTVSFIEALDDYYRIQQNEMILDEIRRGNSILKETQKMNQEYYEKRLQNDAEIIEIGRQACEHLNHLRYDW